MTSFQVLLSLVFGASASITSTRVILETMLQEALPNYTPALLGDLGDTAALARVLERKIIQHQHLMQAAARDGGVVPARQVFVMFGRDFGEVQRIQQLCALHEDPLLRAFGEQLAGAIPGPELPPVRPTTATN